MDIEPYGPRRIAPKNQVSIPAELMAALGLAVGDSVWMTINADRRGTLVMIPQSLVVEIFQAGWDGTRPDEE